MIRKGEHLLADQDMRHAMIQERVPIP